MFAVIMKFVNLFDWKKIFLILLSIMIGVFVLAGLMAVANITGCKTYEPVTWNDKLPPDCNMTLNTYKLYYGSTDKSATVPDATYCYKKLHRLFCQEEIYGRDKDGKILPVDYDNAKKFRDYTQCKDEIR
jgi:hypothetical protein